MVLSSLQRMMRAQKPYQATLFTPLLDMMVLSLPLDSTVKAPTASHVERCENEMDEMLVKEIACLWLVNVKRGGQRVACVL